MTFSFLCYQPAVVWRKKIFLASAQWGVSAPPPLLLSCFFFGSLFPAVSPLCWSPPTPPPHPTPPYHHHHHLSSWKSLTGSPGFISREEGHEIFKAVLPLNPIFRWDRASVFPFFLCLWLWCVCGCMCACACVHRTQQQLQRSLCTADDLHLSHTTAGFCKPSSTCSSSLWPPLWRSSQTSGMLKQRTEGFLYFRSNRIFPKQKLWYLLINFSLFIVVILLFFLWLFNFSRQQNPQGSTLLDKGLYCRSCKL